MNHEYETLMRNSICILVPLTPDMNVISNKWVYMTKLNSDGSLDKFRARLVTRGFQQTEGVDYFDTFNPVENHSTIRDLFNVATTFGQQIQQVDVNNAFLNDNLNETIFMSQPSGFVDPQYLEHMCMLKKALYGLKQAPSQGLV